MKIVGIDLGRRTVGIAISDALETIASPINTYRIRENDLQGALECVKIVIEEYGVGKIVLGLPKNIKVLALLPTGYPKEFKKHNVRKDIKEIVEYR